MVGVEAAVSSSDICGAPSVVLTSITSSEPDNATGSGDGNTVDDIQNAAVGTADFNFDLRAERAGGGGGRVYTVTYRATDAAGNETVAEGTVVVEHDRGGSAEPLLLTVDSSSSGAVVNWNPVEGALHYNVIRTNLSNLREVQHGYVLGAVTCIESVSLDESTLGNEDAEVPEPGEVFLYMAEYNDGERSSFGTVSSAKPRQSGECD